jgi:hypothetical protein
MRGEDRKKTTSVIHQSYTRSISRVGQDVRERSEYERRGKEVHQSFISHTSVIHTVNNWRRMKYTERINNDYISHPTRR